METFELNDLYAFNDQLSALTDAGLTFELCGRHQNGISRAELKHINSVIARRMNRGESLGGAVEGDEELPAEYRATLEFGIQSGKLSNALSGLSRVANSVRESQFMRDSALIYPLILVGFAFVGLVTFCFFLVPTLDSVYRSLELPPSRSLQALLVVRRSMAYWGIGLPLIAAGMVFWWRTRRSVCSAHQSATSRRWTFATGRAAYQERCALFAASLDTLLEKQTPIPEALRIAGGLCGDTKLNSSAKQLAASWHSGTAIAADAPLAMAFPPLLRWAVWHGEATVGWSAALNIAVRTYRDAARFRRERFRTLMPIAAIVLIGGTVTLFYGLTLFLPVTELLRTLATQSGPR